ncbi:unnamed protein product [Brassica napus]|uniref:(rape) hypothetical protein n=1 Tax=Brassica napus TaxID=3708 RepID=A0A816KKS8_BRANA|nr:unnamed protein product [Brassica napus]
MFLDFLSDNKIRINRSKVKVEGKQTQEQRSKSKPSDGFLRQGGGLEKANLCGQNHEGKKEGFSDKTGRKAKKYEVGHQGILKALPLYLKNSCLIILKKKKKKKKRNHERTRQLK